MEQIIVETRRECEKHKLVYDPRTQSGCVLCRHEEKPPRKPLPTWVLPAVGGVLAVTAVGVGFAIISSSSPSVDNPVAAPPPPEYSGAFNLYSHWAEEGKPGDGFQFRQDGLAVLRESSAGDFFFNYTIEEEGPPLVLSLSFIRASHPDRRPQFDSVRLRVSPETQDSCRIELISADRAVSGTRLGVFHRVAAWE